MDLISRKAAIDSIKDPVVKGFAMHGLKNVPSVPAVPLDKLCLLLHDIAGCPCYTQRGEDMCNRLIGDQCNAEWNDVECWKLFLTKWMEGLDAAD